MFLANHGVDVTYKGETRYVGNNDAFIGLITENIYNMHPIIVPIKVSSGSEISDYLPYTTSGHYVVITGTYFEYQTNTQMIIINDPHYAHCAEYVVPASALRLANLAHGANNNPNPINGYYIYVDSTIESTPS